MDTGTGNGHGSGVDIYQDAYHPAANYGLSDFNSANTLVGQVTYELPFGSGRQFALRGPLNQIAGGWRVSTIFQWHGGVPYTRFLEMYGSEPIVFRAPGRINLIGEHTDYNDGFVMPAAIGFYTWIAAQKRTDRSIEAYSEHFKEKVQLSLTDLSGGATGHWSDFVRGVAAVLSRAGDTLTGANLVIAGDIPLGSGMSSSASLEVATALALIVLSNIAIQPLELAKLCQRAEHEYVGTKCGIMDQFAAASGVVGQALVLDCRSLEYQFLSIPTHLSIVICNSMVRHHYHSEVMVERILPDHMIRPTGKANVRYRLGIHIEAS